MFPGEEVFNLFLLVIDCINIEKWQNNTHPKCIISTICHNVLIVKQNSSF